ncbi:MAG: hypothetical protein JXA21_13425 [Anaerolineae bacterium]|nr:hypothetical protein [Anaerolineae bacterium]
MKIIQRDKNTLVVRPGGGFLILFGLIFIAAGLFTMASMCTEYRLVCDRAPNGRAQCRLNKNLLGVTLEEEALDTLQGARLDSHRGSKSTTYEIVLIMPGGEKTVGMSSNVDVRGQQRFVETVNTFVQYPNLTQLDVTYGGIKMIWFGAIFFAVGSLVAIFGLQTQFTTWTFDRLQGTLVRRSETLLGIRTSEYALRDVTEAQVTWSRGSRGSRTYRVELIMRDETTVPLTSFYSSGYNGKERAAATINEFLQLQ